MTVVDWLLDSDPAIRWQVLRDLTGASREEIAAERAGWNTRARVFWRSRTPTGCGTAAPWPTEPLEHPAGAPGPRLVGRSTPLIAPLVN
jgi:hypothetical protein